jgi:hypothetical protein
MRVMPYAFIPENAMSRTISPACGGTMICRRVFLFVAGAAALTSRLSWADQVPASLDHILLGCSDLEAGISFVEQHTGVRAQFGGVHPGRGTRNALLSLGKLHYLEIIAPDPKQTEIQQWAVQRVTTLKQLNSPRLVGWAVHPGNIEAQAGKLRDAGIATQPIFPGSRKRDDGHVLKWEALNLTDDHHGLLPFFIQWSADSPHPSVDAPSGCRLETFVVAGPKPGELAALFQRLGVEVTVERAHAPQLRARVVGPKGALQVSS